MSNECYRNQQPQGLKRSPRDHPKRTWTPIQMASFSARHRARYAAILFDQESLFGGAHSVDTTTVRRILSRDLTDTIIRVGLIIILVAACMQVVAPFMPLLLWALILAIALYPLQRAVAARLGGRQGASASLIVLLGVLLIGTPTVLLGGSFASHLHDAYQRFEGDTVEIRKPDPAVAEWPIVGPRLYSAWNSAAADLPGYLIAHKAQLQNIAKIGLGIAANTAGSIALFIGSLIVAAIVMAFGETGSAAMQRIFSRLTDPVRGPKLQQLSTATVRSVATGVIGVAFIQALLLGVGFMLAGIPAAGVLAFVAMLIGIIQLPALIISLPAIAYLWWAGDASTTSNVIWTVYLLVAGMADNVLKPMLLGRGVDAPMPVILIGALGGMVSAGIIGLFVGAAALAVGYQLFMEWVDNPPEPLDAEPQAKPASAEPNNSATRA
jgi:predicted PurR-regulated permease PerM